MKTVKLLSLLALSLGLAACDESVKIENGKVPQNLLPYAQALTGEYRGVVDGRANQLSLSLAGDVFQAKALNDLVLPGCESEIGALKEVTYSGKMEKNDVAITSATFEFNPNRCPSIEGKRLYIEGIKKEEGLTKFSMRILSETRPERQCHWEVVTGPDGSVYQREVCTTNWVQYFIRGRFTN